MNLSQSAFDFAEKWDKLRNGLALIIKISQGEEMEGKSITFVEWQNLYHVVYEWCTRQEEKKKRGTVH